MTPASTMEIEPVPRLPDGESGAEAVVGADAVHAGAAAPLRAALPRTGCGCRVTSCPPSSSSASCARARGRDGTRTLVPHRDHPPTPWLSAGARLGHVDMDRQLGEEIGRAHV